MSKTQYFEGYENRKLLARVWENQTTWNGKIIVLLHRGHEHSERLDTIANYGQFSDFKKYSYDYRGHGYEKGESCYEFMDLVRDLDCFIKFVQNDAQVKSEDIFIIANSVAGVVSSTWLHDYAPNIAGIALVAPAFKIKLYVPFAKEVLSSFIKIYPKFKIKSYVKAKFLTHDVNEQKKYNDDPLITPDIPASQLVSLLNTAKRIVDDASMITTPTLILSATKDYVVDNTVQGDFYANLSSRIKKFVPLEDFFHGILYETNKEVALNEITMFIKECFENKENYDYCDDLIKITKQQKDKISFGSISLLNNLSYFFQKNFIKYFGFMSQGISVGKQYGFDSGVTLDYIYKNEPKGLGYIGKFIDKNYINSIGWKGIYIRKINLENILEQAIASIYNQKKEPKILDIAGGPAKYLIEMAKKHRNIEILVRDYQQQNIEQGQKYIAEFNLENIQYEQADAFNIANYKNMPFQPNIVVISGVFELFESNSLIQNAIDGVSNILQSGDILLFTNQPWHPQLEQISNVLMNHQHQKWSMRLRSQYEINQLFKKSGFTIDEMLIDNYGIFTVTKARKI